MPADKKFRIEVIKPNGLLFLSTLSIINPEHYGKGFLFPKNPIHFKIEYIATSDWEIRQVVLINKRI